jgi:hypothetical protein
MYLVEGWPDVVTHFVASKRVPQLIELIDKSHGPLSKPELYRQTIQIISIRRRFPQTISQDVEIAKEVKAIAGKDISKLTTKEIVDASLAQNKERQKENAKNDQEAFANLQLVQKKLDALEPSQERVAAYLVLQSTYDQIQHQEDAEEISGKLVSDFLQIQSPNGPSQRPAWVQGLIDWFRPFIHEKSAATACGLIVGLAFMFRPTAQIASKALAYKIYTWFDGPCIRKALSQRNDGSETPDQPQKKTEAA